MSAEANDKGKPPFYLDKSNVMVYTDAGGALRPVESPADWRKRRAHILANMQLVMGETPGDEKKVPPDVRVLEEVELPGCVRKKITFASEEGDRVPAYLTMPLKLEGKAPGMVCLHPTSPYGKGMVLGLGDKPNRQYGLELAQRGYVTLSPDYPTYGDYKVDVYTMGYASATMKGIWNHMRAVDLLQSMPEVDGQRIGAIGHSLGGHNALFLAVFDARVRVAVTSCGFNAFPKYMGGNLAGWSHKGYMPRIAKVYGKDPARMPFDFTEILAAIAPRPVFVNAPTGDSNFEVSGVRDCLEAAAPVYALLGAREKLAAVHPNCAHDFPPEIREAAYAFIDKALNHQPQTGAE